MAWNDLTDRQKQLDRLIDSCGVQLDATNRCVEKVARAIGATSSELGFVQQRIELRLRTSALLDKTDAFISNTEQMLDQFEKDDEEWRKRGRDLGFNF
jgi:hypothetical protein